MTEKRFTQKEEDDWEILENGKHFAYAHSGYQAKKIIETLNELSDKLDCHILLTDQERQKASNFIKGIEKENEQLKQEKEFWKSDACSLSSLNSILSNELSIAQEQGYEPSKPYKEYIASIKSEYDKFWENKIKTHNNQLKGVRE